MNVEIYNYLNLINYKLAKLYKSGLYKPFADDFEVTQQKIKDRLILSQIKINLPEFIFEEKDTIKTKFKNSQKNSKKIIKNLKKYDFSVNFCENFENYLIFRQKITRLILRDFRHQDFNEADAVEQILKLDPIFGELLLEIFEKDCDIEKFVTNLERKYSQLYNKKIKLIEKKNNQKAKDRSKALADTALQKTRMAKEKQSASKEKTATKSVKINKNSVRKSEKVAEHADKNPKTAKMKEI